MLDRHIEVQLVKGVERHHWVQQMGRVEAASADLLRVLEAQQDHLLAVGCTLLNLDCWFGFVLLFCFGRGGLFLVAGEGIDLRLGETFGLFGRERLVEANLVWVVHLYDERLADWEPWHVSSLIVLILARVTATDVILNLVLLVGFHSVSCNNV